MLEVVIDNPFSRDSVISCPIEDDDEHGDENDYSRRYRFRERCPKFRDPQSAIRISS
jgi:hypothetical protein